VPPPVLHDFEPAIEIALEPVDSVQITTLMDNVTDFFMPDQGPAHRVSLGDGPWKTTAVMDNGEVPDALGAHVADVGCGLGASTVLLAEAYPASTFTGSDYHEGSIELARKRAADAGVTNRTTFEVASAQTFSGTGYDLITTFDCLHDMGDPLGAARHIRNALDPDGTWLIVEPFAGDTITDNLSPVGRTYYSFSSFLCVPNARSQPGGYALGAQAGEAAIRQVAIDAGFTRFRRAAETPFNIILEARP
jgi:ubiquinone/menaquinone biosynthesis C-methylase UbiE